jgi:mRNA interferase HigB
LRIISRRALRDAARQHNDLEAPLDVWFKVAKKSSWTCLNDIRNTWRDTDTVAGLTVFNVKGNNYRLIAKINYKSQMVFIKHILTHAEYDEGDWKV